MSMSGNYETRIGERIIEQGSWSYQGHGNAEIAMEASGERVEGGMMFSVTMHSVELQTDLFTISSWIGRENQEHKTSIRGEIAGYTINLHISGGDGTVHDGSVAVPEETVYDGPSPIWLIHLMMTWPLPVDRVITAPFVRFGLSADDNDVGFYRFSRGDSRVLIDELDSEGIEQRRIEIELADDGCPTSIRRGDMLTQVIRVPEAIGLS